MENIENFLKKIRSRKLPTKKDQLTHLADYTGTSHNFLKYILVACQFIGLFPLHNICSEDPSKVKFNWLSWKIVYTITISVSSMFCSYLGFYEASKFHPVITRLLFPVVFTQVTVATLISIKISKNWPKFITSMTYFELEFNRKYGKPKQVRRILMFLIFAIYAIGSVEHLLQIISSALQYGSNGFIIYSQQKCTYLFYECNSCWSVVFSIFCTISWAVCIAIDVFIIHLSVIFASRFKQIAVSFERFNDILQFNEISAINLKDVSKFYKQIREDYMKLTSVVHQVDKLFGNLIICSYVSNVTSILIQLFNSLRYSNSSSNTIIFFYSFGFIILRLALVTIYASSINEESKTIATIIPKVPDDLWNEDLKRIMSRVYYDSTAFTGGKFFKITRGLSKNIAASIISYELILIQFNQNSLNDLAKPENCTNII